MRKKYKVNLTHKQEFHNPFEHSDVPSSKRKLPYAWLSCLALVFRTMWYLSLPSHECYLSFSLMKTTVPIIDRKDTSKLLVTLQNVVPHNTFQTWPSCALFLRCLVVNWVYLKRKQCKKKRKHNRVKPSTSAKLTRKANNAISVNVNEEEGATAGFCSSARKQAAPARPS